MSFIENINYTEVDENEVKIFWLGQAGFLLKTHDKQIAIDPYFSHCVERLIPEEGLGFKRLMPPPCSASELNLDVLIISHEHNDHFDVDAIGDLVKEKTQIYTNKIVYSQMAEMGFDLSRIHIMEKGKEEFDGELRILPVDCDHGELAPEALGVILDFKFTRVYYSGDTALNLERLSVPLKLKPEVAILPINGEFGNMNGYEAAIYAGLLHTKVCIPCHFWTFPLHHGDPKQIIDSIKKEAPDCKLALLCQGEYFLCQASEKDLQD